MRYSIHIHLFFILFMSLLFSSAPGYGAVNFSGYLSGVSTYVWRGVKANNGPALQTDAAFGYDAFTLGLWASSVNFGDDSEVETDFYADVALPTGEITSSLGTNIYMFDFRTFNRFADAEYEIYAKVGYGIAGLNFYYLPKQNSTKEGENRSLYWLEVAAGSTLMGADLSAVVAYGTYSSRWIPEGATKDPVSVLLLTASKPIQEEISIFWTASLDLFNSGFENIFYFGGTYSF